MKDPWARLSDAQKQQIVDDFHKQNQQYLQDFINQGSDPRSLPRSDLPTFVGPSPSLEATLKSAELVVIGNVQETKFVPDPSGAPFPGAFSTIYVKEVVKGQAPTTLTALQVSGPVLGDVLLQFEVDELVLPGDEIILFLKRDNVIRDVYRTIEGGGILFLQQGVIVPEKSNVYDRELADKIRQM